MIYSGFVLRSRGVPLDRQTLTTVPGLSLEKAIAGTRWDRYRFGSLRPLRDEAQLETDGHHTYPLLARLSSDGGRLVVLGPDFNIVRSVIEGELRPFFRPRVARESIAVHRLVQHIIDEPGPFAISFVHARTAAFGESLKSVSFYGNDVSHANFFRANLELFACFAVGLRDSSHHAEILRLRQDGRISFIGTEKLRDVDRVLHFLHDRGFYE
jgi:hypothetical protein